MSSVEESNIKHGVDAKILGVKKCCVMSAKYVRLVATG